MSDVDEIALDAGVPADHPLFTAEPTVDDNEEQGDSQGIPNRRSRVSHLEEVGSNLENLRQRIVAEQEVNRLQRQINTLLRQRTEGGPPALNEDQESVAASEDRGTLVSDSTRAASGSHSHRRRPKYGSPDKFSGKSLKEAKIFISKLETIFDLDPESFDTEKTKVLFGVTYLEGEAQSRWHYTMGRIPEGYRFSQFKAFVDDTVADPINRSFDVGQQYERARQGDHQTAHQFAEYLRTLEDQFQDSYTEQQRAQHYLNKLKPHLRAAITAKGDMPPTLQELVSLASRMETAGMPAYQSQKRQAPEQGSRKLRKQQKSQSRELLDRPKDRRDPNRGPPEARCYGCGRAGHLRTTCTNTNASGYVEPPGIHPNAQGSSQRRVEAGNDRSLEYTRSGHPGKSSAKGRPSYRGKSSR